MKRLLHARSISAVAAAPPAGRFIHPLKRANQTPHRATVACGWLLAFVLAGCTTPSQPESREAVPALTRTILLPGLRGTRPDVGVPGRIDHMAYDHTTGRLFVAALENGSLEVLELETGRRIRSLPGLSRPQGIAVVPAETCAAVACGGDGVLHIFDTRTLEEKRRIEVGPDADNVRFDPRANEVYVSYGTTNRGAIAVFDARTWNKLREITFTSRPESFQLELGGRRLFANLPEGVRAIKDGNVAIVDRQSGRTEAVVPLPGRARNFPMAFDAVHDRLFIATRRPARLITIDTRRAAVVSETDCTDDSDDLFYDSTTGRVLVIGGGFRPDLQAAGTASPRSPPGEMGALEVFRVAPGGVATRVSAAETAPHTRTGLWVAARRRIYLAVPMRGATDAEIREYCVD